MQADWGGGNGGTGEGIRNSYARGSVKASSTATSSTASANAGGLVGSHGGGGISKSYATGSVEAEASGSGDLRKGGLVGSNFQTISDSYWDRDTTEQMDCYGDWATFPPEVPCNTVGLTTAQMKSTSSPSGLGPAFRLGGGYPRLRQCKIDPMTGACAAVSFLDKLVPGQ